MTFAGWEGDGISSGLVGLAFPNITSEFSGSDPSTDSASTQIVYNPIFTNMYTEGSVAPVFSLAIERNNNTGVLAIGGVPSGLTLTAPNASTPFEYLVVDGKTENVRQFYSIDVGASIDGRTVEGFSSAYRHSSSRRPSRSTQFQVIVDSGTTLLYLPDGLSELVNELFDPPAEYVEEEGAYFVDCAATPPALDIVIGGAAFPVNAQDLILAVGDDTCISGVTDAGDMFGILGDVFLKSVLAVFDVGASEMRFVEHSY